MIQAVIFDFGGVLTQDHVTAARLQQYDALLGWPPGTLLARLFQGESWEAASIGAMREDEHWVKAGADVEDRLPPQFRGYRYSPFHDEPLNEEVVKIVHSLKGRARLALCSNALKSLRAQVESSSVLCDLFDVMVISAEVGLRKPDPRIFHLTAERLGLPLAQCLLVDDKVRNTDAAQAMGMRAVPFTTPGELREYLRREMGGEEAAIA